jgi:hypothetical protein
VNRPDFNDRCDQSRLVWVAITVLFAVGYVAVLSGWRP